MIKNNFNNLFNKFNKNWQHRFGHKMSLNEFHNITGISRPMIFRWWHNCSHSITYKALGKLCDFFNVGPDKIIQYVPNKQGDKK